MFFYVLLQSQIVILTIPFHVISKGQNRKIAVACHVKIC